MEIQPKFKSVILDVYKEKGAAWLDALPRLIASLADEWSLEIEDALPNLAYNYVCPAKRANGRKAILKLGVPGGSIKEEAIALLHFDGQGAVEVLESDAARGALLLERAFPGTPLYDITLEGKDEEAAQIAANVKLKLWKPPSPDTALPTAIEWFEGFERLRAHFGGSTGPLPFPLVEQAESLASELSRSAGEAVVLHGDLHHWNVLSSERDGWLAIDPHGRIGERAAEVAAFMHNPHDQLNANTPLERLERRLAVFAEKLQIDRTRLRAWSVVMALLSCWWTIEDHGEGWEPGLEVAELMAKLKE